MIKIENVDVLGWESAIRGMRNPLNSWDKSDSKFTCWGDVCEECYYKDDMREDEDWYWCDHKALKIGEADLKLMKSLSKAGSDHGKFLRMINVTFDVTAPLYWYKEFDTYKVGTVANSCSTMHKIQAKVFELDDFSHEHLTKSGIGLLQTIVDRLNDARDYYNNFNEYPLDEWEDGISCKKDIWWTMIQLLPSSYNQKRTVQLNYQVLKTMYHARKLHKLDEWREFCAWCETLPYFKEICLNE